MSEHSQATIDASSEPVATPATGSVLERHGVTEEDWREENKSSVPHGSSITPATPPDQPIDRPTFSRLKVHGDLSIHDDDEIRAQVTRWLLHELAPLLGLDPDRIQIRVNSEAESRVNARGAKGVMEGGTIYLHPRLYQPNTKEGRELLAHEATHLAQLNAPATPPVSEGRAVHDAETEADEFAALFVEKLPVRLPQRRAPHGHALAKETGDTKPEPSHAALVAQNRTSEIAIIKDRLSYGVFDWKITDEDIIDILRELESLEFLSITAVAELLSPKDRARFADNLDAVHFTAFRSTVIAFYLGIANKGEIAVLPEDPFPGMNWSGFTDAEHYAMREILPAFRDTSRGRTWFSNLPHKTQEQIEDIRTKPLNFKVDEEREKARKKEEKVATERKQAEAALQAKDVQSFIELAKKKLSWVVTDSDALAVLDGMSDFISDPTKLRAIVTALEREGSMDTLIDNLPVESLYTDAGDKTGGGRVNRRRIFLQIIALRPPAKNTALAENLLSYGFFDWAITDEEAYLAQQVLKAVSPRARESFFALKGGKFAKRLDAELSLSMKKGQTANFYQGGEEGRDLAKLKSQLADDALWSLEQINRLGMLIRMAIAAGEGDFVFAQTKDRYTLYEPFRELYKDKNFFSNIIEGFKLYKPAGLKRPDGTIDKGREQYVGEPPVEGKKFFHDNGFWTYFIQGLDFIAESGNVIIIGESIGGKGLDFGEFQDITGGTFLGAEFKREEQVPAEQQKELADNAVLWDLDHGVLQLRAKRLEIANINYPMANFKLQSGPATVSNLHMHLQYPTEQSEHKLTTLQLRADSLLLNDVLFISSESMTGLQSILVEGFTLELRPENVEEAFSNPKREIQVAIPIFGPLISMIVNVAKLSGSIDELTKGLLTPDPILDVTVTTQNVQLKGLTTSGGQYIDDISLGKLDLRTRYARSLEFYIRSLNEEKERLKGRLAAVQKAAAQKGPKSPYHLELDTEPSLKLQLESIDRELAYIEEAQAERTRLTQLKDEGKLSPADEHKLWKVSKYLDGLGKGGVALNVASVKVSGLAGKVSAKEVEVGEVHGYGQSAGAALGFLISSTTMNRMLRGRDYRGTVQGIEEEGDPQFFLETSKVTVKELAIEATVPTVEEAEKALKKANDLYAKYPNDASLLAKRNRAEVLRDAANTYWTILAKPGNMIVGAERDALTKAREELTKERAFFAGLLELKDVALELGKEPSGGERVGVTAGTLHGERLAAGGVAIGAIDGKNVMVGAESRGGLSALLKDWRKEIKSGQFAADSLVATNIVHAASGATVDKVALTTAGATLDVDGQGKINVQATKVEVTGVSIVATRKLLEAEKEFLLMVPAEARHEADDKKIAAIDESLKELDAYEASERECQTALDEARKSGDPKEIAKAEETLKFATFVKTEWQRRLVLRGLSIDQLNISVLGLGNVLDEDFDPKAAIDKGFEVHGGGHGKRWFDAARLQDSRIPGLSGDEVVLGPTGGTLKHKAEETVLDDFFIDSIEATGLEFHAPPHHLSSRGTSKLTGLRGSATFTRVKRPDKKGFETWQLASIKVPQLKIDKIEADNLSYAYSTLDGYFALEIESGSIGNIWADNLQIDFNENDQVEMHGIDPDKPGGAGIDAVDNVKLVGFLGKKIQAGGVLNGRGIKAEFINAKKQRYTIEEISATKGKFSQPGLDLGFTVRRLGLAVTREITDTGDVFDIEKISIPDVTITTGSTFTKGGLKIELLGTVNLTGIALSAKVKRTKEGQDYKVTSAVITDLIIPDITATSVHVTVEGKPADPAKGTKESAPIDVLVPNATIKDLHVWGFDLLNMKGTFETKSANVTDMAVEIGKKGEAEFKKIGLSIKSTGLAGVVSGPDHLFLDLGNIDLTGSYEGGGVEVKKFSLSGIGGFVDKGPDYLRVFDLDTGPMKVGPVVYTDDKGNRLDIDSIDATAVHLKELEAKWTKDATTKEEKLSEFTFSGLKFDKLEARGFKYKGSFHSENAKKQKVESQLDLAAWSATLDPLVIEEFKYDALKDLISVQPRIEKASITQFQTNFVQYVDGRFAKKAKVVTDVTAKQMKANLTFGKITSATGDAWEFSSGTFHLDGFGLKHPKVDYMGYDEKGVLQEWGVEELESAKGALDLTGIDVTFLPDGSKLIKFDALTATDLSVWKKGSLLARIPFAEIKDIAAATKGKTLDEALDNLALKTGTIQLKGLSLLTVVNRGAPASGATTPIIVEPLDGATGEIHGNYDAPVIGWVTFDLPVNQGRIDLYRSSLLGHRGDEWEGNEDMEREQETNGYYLYLNEADALVVNNAFYNYEVEETRHMAGFHHTQGKRGTIVLREMVEGIYNAPPSGAAPAPLGFLNNIGLRQSEMKLGGGKVGTAENFVVLPAGEPARNVFNLLAHRIGTQLRASGNVKAESGHFKAGDKDVTTGVMDFASFRLVITGLGTSLTVNINLIVEEGVVHGVEFGDVTIIDTAKKGQEEYRKENPLPEAKKASAATP